MEELKAMFRVCVHIKKDGIRCNSPALKGGNFCFQHIGGSIRELTRARSTYNGRQLDFLYPGTRQAIQHNLFVVAQAMNDGNLELATANTYNRLFSTCERNLRRWEMQQKKSGPEPELLEVPDDASEEPTFSPLSENVGAPSFCAVSPRERVGEAESKDTDMEAGAPCLEKTWVQCDQTTQLVIPTEVSVANEAEEPALPSPSHSTPENTETPSTDGGPLKPGLSGEHKHTVSKADREPDNPGPEPSPETEPLELTPEEIEIFNDLETRYINDPSLADRIRDTYRQIREQRRTAKKQISAS